MLSLGIDIGTSGVRMAVIDADGAVISTARGAHPPQPGNRMDARLWWQAVHHCLTAQIAALRRIGRNPDEITDLACDGTSGTMVLVDDALTPVTDALMYNSAGFEAEARRIAEYADPGSITLGANSALARMLRLQALDAAGHGRHLLHQADYVAACLCGTPVGSDDNNALKLGFDPESQSWPDWFAAAGVRVATLPDIHRPGDVVGLIAPALATTLGFRPGLRVHAGTTDSIAAFIAGGASETGDAVTSLGSTLAIKLLSDTRVDDAASGVYSHRLHGRWLAGGASNTGGAVLAHYFSPAELEMLSSRIDISTPCPLAYYPLLKPGERFPVNDPMLAPRLTPRPTRPEAFLYGMLDGMARIERQAYDRLSSLGAPYPQRVFTCGGGAANAVWSKLRHRHLARPILAGASGEASVGAAHLARTGP
ncbi:FGGY-family carbohydrate kinase [Rhodophyticola sp. CCM32]|uniref:FGGY-family carbohydrate kinase n=1 Tax=Rhodophyticola sp. CCM32 TaxID=2916397 RepID=UPI001EE56573|nr:FGGY-family carbohydrate kinase [Rhodophyticola sp. CCM32]